VSVSVGEEESSPLGGMKSTIGVVSDPLELEDRSVHLDIMQFSPYIKSFSLYITVSFDISYPIDDAMSLCANEPCSLGAENLLIGFGTT
jgi:hypothetical protein